MTIGISPPVKNTLWRLRGKQVMAIEEVQEKSLQFNFWMLNLNCIVNIA